MPQFCTACPDQHPNGHYIPSAQLIKHNLEIKRRKMSTREPQSMENRVTVSTPEAVAPPRGIGALASSLDSPSLSDQGPAGKTVADNSPHIADVADMLASVTLADGGPNVHDQPSKLWTSSADHQKSFESESPVLGITPADVHQSLHTVLSARDPPSLPATQTKARFSARLRGVFRPKAHRSLAQIHSVHEECRGLYDQLMALEDIDYDDDTLVLQRHQFLDHSSMAAKKLGLSLLSIKRIRTTEFDDAMTSARKDLQRVDNAISVIGAHLPPAQLSEPIHFASEYLYDDPLKGRTLIAQLTIFLTVACSMILGLSNKACDFVVTSLRLIVDAAMCTVMPRLEEGAEGPQHAARGVVLDQLPTSLYTALKALKLDSKSSVLAVCPACSFCHKPEYRSMAARPVYASHCKEMVVGESGRHVCGAALLEVRHGVERPIKPFVVCSLDEHLARILSDPELERMCDEACDEAMKGMEDASPHSTMRTVFDGKFLRTFRGPDNTLFIDRKGKVRLALAMQVDFFNPNGTRKRGNHDSIGLISFAILNLHESVRYRPENIFLAGVIPGPREPDSTELPKYIAPIIDMCVAGWKLGVRLTRTALQPLGRLMEYAVAVSVNDLPAARKVAGAAGTGSAWCTVCNSYHRIYDTSFENWERRDRDELRRYAESWRDADTLAERASITESTGIRWSELWRLPYWDPTQMLVVDSMHCILEGLVHYHCRHVLMIQEDEAKKAPKLAPAFSYPWTPYVESDVHADFRLAKDKPVERLLGEVEGIQRLLEYPLNSGEGSFDEESLSKKLSRYTLSPLRYIAWTLGVHETEDPEKTVNTSKRNQGKLSRRRVIVIFNGQRIIPKYTLKSKHSFVNALIAWRHTQPRSSGKGLSARIDINAIHHIQNTIKNTLVPSWINSVPHLYGQRSVGTLKADEWRTLATIYLPIALVTLWGYRDATPRTREVLQHTMNLFQAVDIVCRFTMTHERSKAYRDLLRNWVDGLHEIHPHTKTHRVRPNVHAAFHIFDFLELFGPVSSWWTFPFERLIGTLQNINTNDHIGGVLESTITQSFTRAANFRRLINRPSASPVMLEFQRLFNKAFGSQSSQLETNNESPPDSKNDTHAHYRYHGVTYSRAQIHIGNSLVRYRCPGSGTTHVGSINEIRTVNEEVLFYIHRQLPLPPGRIDPFSRYPWFSASSLSASMATEVEAVSPRQVLGHVARFQYSETAVAVLDLSRD